MIDMFGLSDDILPQEERPTFISIARYEAYSFGPTMFRQQLGTSVFLQQVN